VPADPVKAGKDFRIHAEVSNAGASALRNVAVTLIAPQELVLRDPVTQVLSRLGPGAVQAVHWAACTAVVGGYVVVARAAAGSFIAQSTGQLVQVGAAKQARC